MLSDGKHDVKLRQGPTFESPKCGDLGFDTICKVDKVEIRTLGVRAWAFSAPCAMSGVVSASHGNVDHLTLSPVCVEGFGVAK